jgi:hypothetical protein
MQYIENQNEFWYNVVCYKLLSSDIFRWYSTTIISVSAVMR